MTRKSQMSLTVTQTGNHCPIGETVGSRHMTAGSVPVLSCEGACIRGEIARQAANRIAKQPGYGRACHGELLSVPNSAIARWVQEAEKTVLIDGCFLRCHGRILEHMLDPQRLIQFDALSIYKKYTDIFDPEDVPETERQETVSGVVEKIMDDLSMGRKPCAAVACDSQKPAFCGKG